MERIGPGLPNLGERRFDDIVGPDSASGQDSVCAENAAIQELDVSLVKHAPCFSCGGKIFLLPPHALQ
jgi:hypothetical protein